MARRRSMSKKSSLKTIFQAAFSYFACSEPNFCALRTKSKNSERKPNSLGFALRFAKSTISAQPILPLY